MMPGGLEHGHPVADLLVQKARYNSKGGTMLHTALSKAKQSAKASCSVQTPLQCARCCSRGHHVKAQGRQQAELVSMEHAASQRANSCCEQADAAHSVSIGQLTMLSNSTSPCRRS